MDFDVVEVPAGDVQVAVAVVVEVDQAVPHVDVRERSLRIRAVLVASSKNPSPRFRYSTGISV